MAEPPADPPSPSGGSRTDRSGPPRKPTDATLSYCEVAADDAHATRDPDGPSPEQLPKGARTLSERSEPTQANIQVGSSATPHWSGAVTREIPGGIHPVEPLDEPPPVMTGYEILQELGRGNMGVVYLARQKQLNRLVALKMIRGASQERPETRGRFRVEAEAVARLRHANIIQIYEIGEQDGCPFFSLEYVEGGTLTQRLDAGPVTVREAAEWVELLARAMHHAHQRGIIHRDLKPSNVLLTLDGQLKIGDFGLAKRLDDVGQTKTNVIMGTPSYMAPEQAQGKSREAGPPADIYALGAVLYEILTGRPPFRAGTTMDTLRQLLSEEPVPPRRLHSMVPRDLETICLKCLEKEPAGRYATAEAFADDLRRYLQGEPIVAQPSSIWTRTVKLARRRPALAALVVVIFVAAVSVLAFAAISWRNAELRAAAVRDLGQAHVQLADAHRDLNDTRSQVQKQEDLLQAKQADVARQESKLKEIAKQGRRIRYAADMQLAMAAAETNHIARLHELLDKYRRPPEEEEMRGFEWYYLWRVAHGERLTLVGHTGSGVNFVAASADGKTIASCGVDRSVILWDAATGKQLGRLTGFTHSVNVVAFTPDSRTLAVASLSGTIILYDLATQQPQAKPIVLQQDVVQCMTFDRTGRTIVAGTVGGLLKRWEVASRKEELSQRAHKDKVSAVVFSPDGKTFATAGLDKTVKLWEAGSGALQTELPLQPAAVMALAYAPDGKTLAVGGLDGVARLWDVESAKLRTTLLGHRQAISCLEYAPDGKTLATGSWDQTVKLWDPATEAEKATLKGHTREIRCLAWVDQGQTVVTGGADNLVKVWDLTKARERTILDRPAGAILSITVSPDGRMLACGGTERVGGRLVGVFELWDLVTGKQLAARHEHQGSVTSVVFSPDGKTLATASVDKTVKLWDVPGVKFRATLVGHSDAVGCLAFSADGTHLASSSADYSLKLWNLETGKELRTMVGRRQMVRGMAMSADGQLLAAGYADGNVGLFDAAGKELATLEGHTKSVRALALAHDGKTLASGSDDGTARLWDVAGHKCLATLAGHETAVLGLAFAPDGITLATAGRTVKLWDLRTHQERVTIQADPHHVLQIAFAPGGRRLVGGTVSGAVIIWDGVSDADLAAVQKK